MMTPTCILQREEMERRVAAGLPQYDSLTTDCTADTSTLDDRVNKLRNKFVKNKWRDIKKGKIK